MVAERGTQGVGDGVLMGEIFMCCGAWSEDGHTSGCVVGRAVRREYLEIENKQLRAAHIDALQWVKRLNWIISPDFDGSEDLRSTHKDVSNWLAEQREAVSKEKPHG